MNSDTNRIYVTNLGAGGVQVIDGATDSIVTTVHLPYNPNSVAVNHVTDKIYVYEWVTLKSHYGQIDVVDGTTNTVIKTIVIPGAPTNDFSVAVNPITNRIYATAQTTSDQLLVIDGSSDTIIDMISVPTGVASVAVNLSPTEFMLAAVESAAVKWP